MEYGAVIPSGIPEGGFIVGVSGKRVQQDWRGLCFAPAPAKPGVDGSLHLLSWLVGKIQLQHFPGFGKALRLKPGR